MKQEVAQAIYDELMNRGVEARISDDYSGRGMYGDTTWSVTFPSYGDLMQAVFTVGYDAASNLHPTICDDDFDFSFDSMGYDMVAY